MSSDLFKARLAAAERRWAWEDKQRGYTLYRHGKPVRRLPQQSKKGMSDDLPEHILLLLITVIFGIVLFMQVR